MTGRYTRIQYETMLEIVAMLLDDPDSAPEMTPILDTLRAALGGDGCILTIGVPRRWQYILAGTPQEKAIPIGDLNRSLPPHPLMRHYARTGDRSVLSVDDVAGPSWPASPTYTVVRDMLGISPRQRMRQFAMPMHAPAGVARSFVIYRAGRDFGAGERAFAQRLQPLLHRADRHLQVLSRHRRRQRAPTPTTTPAPTPPAPAAVAVPARDVVVTPRERTVLTLLGDGLTAAAIGRQLRISVSTVNTHLEHVYRKLDTRDRLSTVLCARDLGLIAQPATRLTLRP